MTCARSPVARNRSQPGALGLGQWVPLAGTDGHNAHSFTSFRPDSFFKKCCGRAFVYLHCTTHACTPVMSNRRHDQPPCWFSPNPSPQIPVSPEMPHTSWPGLCRAYRAWPLRRAPGPGQPPSPAPAQPYTMCNHHPGRRLHKRSVTGLRLGCGSPPGPPCWTGLSLSRTSCNNNMHYYLLSASPPPSGPSRLFFSIFLTHQRAICG